MVGYWLNDLRQQRDWAESTDLQEEVLAEIERADAPDSSVVLVFDYPAQVAPRVPVLNTYDLYPAAQLRTVRASRPIRSLPAPTCAARRRASHSTIW